MRAITVRQPWAWVIAEASALSALGLVPKLVENRSRRFPSRHVGHDVAIHAGQRWDEGGGDDPRVREAWSCFVRARRAAGHPYPPLMDIIAPRGVVLAVARVEGVHQTADSEPPCCLPWGEATRAGRPAWHLLLGRVRRLPQPVPARGQLAVPWTLPGDVAQQVQRQLDDERSSDGAA